MLWITNHRLLTLSLLSVFASFSFCLFGFVSPSFATSFSIDLSTAPSRFDVLSNFSDLSFTPTYVIATNLTTNSSCANINPASNTISPLFFISYFGSDISTGSAFFKNPDCSFTSVSSISPNATTLKWGSYSFPPSGVHIVLTDEDSFFCPSCPDCPEIPETPYGDKLDKIYNAIIIASGTILVIYFFFAIYSMFFGGLKR